MELVNGYTLTQIHEVEDVESLYNDLMNLIVSLGNAGVIHGDFNEFNIMVTDDATSILIDFPQMVSTSHANARMFFERDVNGVREYFRKRFGFGREILIGGDCVSNVYYKLDETAEEFSNEDGQRWFKTGDIGEFHEDGVLKIIDRKKDLVKLQAGEHVSLGKVEIQLKTCSNIDNICVYGESSKYFTVALVVSNQKHLKEFAFSLGFPDTGFEELCTSPVVNKAVLKEITEHSKKCKLQKFEIPTVVTLCKEVWTPGSGLYTALKLKRKDIQKRYKQDLIRMYASSQLKINAQINQ